MLQHILIIPDGNRRWARQRGNPGHEGHAAGAETAKNILRAALERRLPALTLWCASAENLQKRSLLEVNFLFKIFGEYFTKLIEEENLKKHRVRVRALGRLELLPKSLQDILRQCTESTKNNTAHSLTFLLGYSGKDDMRQAIAGVAAQIQENPDAPIDDECIKSHLWTKDLPPVDLVIRTGGEPHLSTGVMMWDIADARLYFTKTLWPDFSPEEFEKAIDECSRTELRNGA